MTIAHQLGIRLFLEGIEVPVVSAQISVQADTPAAATIQIIATDKSLDILPRTMVHLFFYDFVDATSPLPILKNSITWSSDLDNYKLLFMGEVQGLSFSKDPGNRSMLLSCIDFSNYWDTTYQYNFQGELIGGRREAAFIGAGANFATSPLGNGTGTISRLLCSNSVNFPKLRGLLAGIVRVLEAIGGSYRGKETFTGANEFTAIAELRCKILQQICAAEEDTSTSKLFARKTFNMWMNREIGSLGKLITFRGLTQLMQGFVYHNVYPCPAPLFQAERTAIPQINKVSLDLSKDPRTRSFMDKIKQIAKLSDRDVSLLLDIKERPSDAYYQELDSNLQKEISLMGSIMESVPAIKGVNLQSDVSLLSSAFTEIKKWISGPVSGFALDRTLISKQKNADEASKSVYNVFSICGALLGKRSTQNVESKYDAPARVNNQIFRPDIWYAPAPRCNVLFPEMYSSIQWSRNFLREVSRLELQTTNEILGSDAIFNGRYYAPNVKDMRKGLTLSSRQFFGLIMQHELLTGIIPMYEKMTQANLYSMKSAGINTKAAKVSYAQRAVNHQYFKHRFSSRQMSVTGRFNPWFVPGFPAVVIDRPMTADNLTTASLPLEDMQTWWKIKHGTSKAQSDLPTRAEIMQELVGVQYTGSCVQMNHSVTQAGGNTSYTFAQARVHRETVEYLGVDKVKVSELVAVTNRKYKVAAIEDQKPIVGNKGIFNGKITAVADITKAFDGQVLNEWTNVIDRRRVGDPVDDSVTPPVLWNAYEVSEKAEYRKQKDLDLPVEEAIKPPWIWDGWSNLKIGDTYRQFFGTNSVTDVEGIASAEMINTSLLAVEEEIALYETADGYETGSGRGMERTETGISDRKPPPKVRNRKPKRNVAAKPTPNVSPAQETSDGKLTDIAAYIINSSRTIEASIDSLVRVYSLVKSSGLDVGLFIRNYTWRPVATLTEILGSEDLVVEEDAKGHPKVKSGTLGFHSLSFGDKANLFGLVDDDIGKILGISDESRRTTAVRLDMRQKRWQVIKAYYEELMESRGLLG